MTPADDIEPLDGADAPHGPNSTEGTGAGPAESDQPPRWMPEGVVERRPIVVDQSDPSPPRWVELDPRTTVRRPAARMEAAPVRTAPLAGASQPPPSIPEPLVTPSEPPALSRIPEPPLSTTPA